MSERAKVVVADFITDRLEPERRILGDLAEVNALNARSENDLAGHVENADVVLLYHFVGLGARTIERLERCKAIIRCGVGYDNVDCAAARRRGIPVANVPDYGTEDVADSAIGLMLALTRSSHYLNSRLRRGQGDWIYALAPPTYRIRGRVFGIVGIGRIGTATALRAKAFGMDVVYYDPYVPQGRDRSLGVRSVDDFEDLLSQSHVVSMHCPLTPETRHMIDRRALALMPRGSFVLNTARGGVVDTMAVLEALESGHLAGAAIDVLEIEPPPFDNPLVVAWRDANHPAHDRLIINPHSAFYTEEGLMDIRVKSSRNCRRVLLGQPLLNVVN
jgi:C-terminal binding protein